MNALNPPDSQLSILSIFSNPSTVFIRHWNWKAALLGAAGRAPIFLVATHSYGWHSAMLAVTVETGYRAGTAGFFAAFTQAVRNGRPTWLAALLITIGVPGVSLGLDYLLHLLMATPNLAASIAVSLILSALASLFTWYSMRRGTLLVGSEQDSFANDLRRLPRLVLAFLLAPLAWMRRCSRRLLNYGLLILACLILPPRCFAQDSRAGTQPALNAEEIVAAMMSRNEARAAALHGYTGHRFYHLNYRGFPSDKDAEMVVEVRYSAPSTKQFTVLSQNG